MSEHLLQEDEALAECPICGCPEFNLIMKRLEDTKYLIVKTCVCAECGHIVDTMINSCEKH